MLARLRTLVRNLLRRRRAESELDDELPFHVEMETESNVNVGMDPVEARRVAVRDLGGVDQTKEAVRDVRTIWLDWLWRDVRLALRMLRRNPGFATVWPDAVSPAIMVELRQAETVRQVTDRYLNVALALAWIAGVTGLNPAYRAQVATAQRESGAEAAPSLPTLKEHPQPSQSRSSSVTHDVSTLGAMTT
jgi:hypothetical protein